MFINKKNMALILPFICLACGNDEVKLVDTSCPDGQIWGDNGCEKKCMNGDDCPPGLACSDNHCTIQCVHSDECGIKYDCVDHHCSEKSEYERNSNIKHCTRNTDCGNLPCVEGYCCDSLCSGVCESCAIPGYLGLCTPISLGEIVDGCSDISEQCDNNAAVVQQMTCNGQGECAPKIISHDDCNELQQTCTTHVSEDGGIIAFCY